MGAPCPLKKKRKYIGPFLDALPIEGISLAMFRVIYIYHGPPKPTFLEVFMVNNQVFRWPKPFFFMVLGAHGIYIYPP